MKIEKFEDIKAWAEARRLTKEVYALTSQGGFSKDFRLKDQIRDAAASVMANIAEGFDSQSDVEFIRFLVYSRRSASEVQSHLYVALDQQYIPNEHFMKLSEDIVKIKNLIYGFIRYLRKTKKGMSDVGNVRSPMSGKGQPSDIGCRTSDVGRETSDVGRETSDVGPKTSDIGLRTSDIPC